MSQFFVNSNGGGGGADITIEGDTGSATSDTFMFTGVNGGNSTLRFAVTGTEVALTTDDANGNLIIGKSSLTPTGITTANSNIGYGNVFIHLTTGQDNIAIGNASALNLQSGTVNVAVGDGALSNLISGGSNIAIGDDAGSSYVGAESNNIVISNQGISSESNVTRIGSTQTTAFMAGITGNTVSNPQVVTINSATGQLGVTTAAFISQVNVQVFTSSGTYTPTTGMKYCTVEIVGGGGGGGGCAATTATQAAAAGGGGGGGYERQTFSAATIGASQSVTIGAAGTAGTSTPSAGGAAGFTLFGVLIQASGGLGGALSNATILGVSNGGAGGVAIGGGNFGCNGTPGERGLSIFSTTALVMGGSGGSSFFGGGRLGPIASTSGGVALSYGGGGAGGASANGIATPGGAGFAGICIITEYI